MSNWTARRTVLVLMDVLLWVALGLVVETLGTRLSIAWINLLGVARVSLLNIVTAWVVS